MRNKWIDLYAEQTTAVSFHYYYYTLEYNVACINFVFILFLEIVLHAVPQTHLQIVMWMLTYQI
jgi:hypothetical protein